MGRIKLGWAVPAVLAALLAAGCGSAASGSGSGTQPATAPTGTHSSASAAPSSSAPPATTVSQTACGVVPIGDANLEMGVSAAYPETTTDTPGHTVCSFGNVPGLHHSTIVFVTELSCGSYAASQWAIWSKGATLAPGGNGAVYGVALTHNASQFERWGHGCVFSAVVAINATNGHLGSASTLTKVMNDVRGAA
jgi:hypothetical protein